MVKFGKTANYGSLAGDELNRVSNHSVTLLNLNPATLYRYKAVSFDVAGNMGSSESLNFTTLNVAGEVVTTTPEVERSEPAIEPDDDLSVLEKVSLDVLKTSSFNHLLRALAIITANPEIKRIPESSFIDTIKDITRRVVSSPSIQGLRPDVSVKGNTAVIMWTTDKNTSGFVDYAKQGEYRFESERPYTSGMSDPGKLSNIHVVTLENLEPATQYHFQVSSKGEIGGETRSKDFVFTTESVLPKIEDATIVAVKAAAVDLSWKTNIPTASTIDYTNRTTQKTLSVGDPALYVNHTFTVPNLEPGTPYNLVIKAHNESGQSDASPVLSFTTTIDHDKPIITTPSANSTLYPGKESKVQTIISWKTDEPATSQVFYQEGVQDNGKVASTTPDTALTLDHILVLTNFKPGTVYKYWIESKDPSGNSALSETFTMLTPIQKETIIDIIGKNFQSVFGWTKHVTF